MLTETSIEKGLGDTISSFDQSFALVDAFTSHLSHSYFSGVIKVIYSMGMLCIEIATVWLQQITFNLEMSRPIVIARIQEVSRMGRHWCIRARIVAESTGV